MLDKIHRRATKPIPGLGVLSYEEILKEYFSNNTGDANIERDQMKVFEILNGHDNIDPFEYIFQN